MLDLANLKIVKYYDLASTYSEVCNLLILYLTIPVTVTSAERSFTKLKIIKIYLKNSMSQNRLSSLPLSNIEAEFADTVEIKVLINKFAKAKAKRSDKF